MRLTRTMALALAMAMLGACGRASDAGSDSGSASAGEAAEGSGGSGGSAGGLAVRVVLTGGKHAGTYQRESREATCIDYAQLGLGAADFSQGTKGLTTVDFGTKAKTAEGTDDFSMTLSFADGDPMSATHYRLDPRKRQGTGTAKVTGRAPRYTVEVTGKTTDGVGIAATIRCLG